MTSIQKTIAFKGGNAHYTVSGKGPAVVFLHGFLENSSMWEVYEERLNHRFKVLAIDLPGHGKTTCFGYVHSMELMAEMVLGVLKKEKLRKVSFVGHSMGGYVALAFAEAYPDMMKGLCLFFSTARADTKVKKEGRNKAISLVKRNAKSFVRHSIPLLFRPKNRILFRDEIKALKSEALRTSKQGIIAALEGMKIRDDREIVIKFAPYPVHFVIGEKDPIIPLDQIMEQLRDKPHISYKVIKGCGHMGHIEEREWCWEEIQYAVESFS